MHHERLEDVQLKVSVHAANGHGRLVAHDLRADHGQGLALRRVDLAWHDGAPGLVLGKTQFAKSAARARTQETNVLRDLEERACEGVEGAVGFDDGVVCSKTFELVRSRLEFFTSGLRNLGGDGLGEAFERVDAGTYGGASLSEIEEARKRSFDALYAVGELLCVT